MTEIEQRPIWLPLQDAANLWDKAITQSGGTPTAGEMNRAFSEALATGEFTALGVCIDGTADAEDAPLNPIPAYYFRQPRTFRFGRIEAWSNVTPTEKYIEARKLRSRHPDWEDVVFKTAEFEAWLDQVLGRPVKRTKTGPKPKLDEKEFQREVMKYVKDNGLPDPSIDPTSRQADLERHMMLWHREAVSESTNRKYVTKALRAVKDRWPK